MPKIPDGNMYEQYLNAVKGFHETEDRYEKRYHGKVMRQLEPKILGIMAQLFASEQLTAMTKALEKATLSIEEVQAAMRPVEDEEE